MNKYKGFISYAHKDNNDVDIANIFINKFKDFSKNNSMGSWTDKELIIGNEWFEEIKYALNECHFCVFLVSESFISSEFIKDHEFDEIIALTKEKGTKIFPILLNTTNFKSEKIKSEWIELLKRQIFKFNGNSYSNECLIQNDGKYIHDFKKDHYIVDIVNLIKEEMEKIKDDGYLIEEKNMINEIPIKKEPSIVSKNFNEAKKLLDVLYPWTELVDEENGNIKYQYWLCGKKESPYYYLILFPSTSTPVKAIDTFVTKIKNKQIRKPTNLLTILKNSNVQKSTLLPLTKENIENRFYTYKDYYWEECIHSEIKSFEYGIEDEEYYIEQYLYNSDNEHNSKEVGKVSQIVMEFIDNDSSKPLLALIAEAGTGKTTFIEHIINKIDKKKQSQCIFISSEYIKEKYSNINSLPNIETIYDLYECSDDPRKFDVQRLSMGVTNGSIIILVDGLEEIITHFGSENKFDNEKFFSSLLSINNELGQCKVIVTSRELAGSANGFLNREEVQVYKLKGFDDKLVDEYLKKRFETKSSLNKESSEKHVKRARKYILEIKQKINNDNKVIPYILDLICESVEEEFEDDKEELSFEIHDDYLSNHDVIDNIIYSYFFERELTRQSYPDELTAKDLAYFVIGLSVEFGWVFTKAKLIEVIELYYPTQATNIASNLIKSPLLKKSDDGSYKFKYDFLMNYFLCLFLIQEFAGKDTNYEISKVLSKVPAEILDDFKKYFIGKNSTLFMENAKKILEDLLSNINDNNSVFKNSISNLILLLIKVNSEVSNSEKNIKLIKELYSNESNILKKLYIYNKFVCLDLKDTEIWDSEFSNYSNFFGSKFSNTKFVHCSFSNMKKYYNQEKIWPEIIFDTCEIGDLKEIIDNEKSVLSSKKMLIRILTEIKNNSYSSVNDDKKYIEKLLDYEYIKKVGNSFRLQRKGKQFIKNGTITKKTKELLDSLV